MAGTMEVRDVQRAGEFFIQHAKAGTVPSAPNVDEMIKLLRGHGIVLDGYTKIHFHQDSDTEKHFVVPAKRPIEETEAALDRGEDYPLTQAHIDMYRDRLCPDTPAPKQPPARKFFVFRIGDYSTGHCA